MPFLGRKPCTVLGDVHITYVSIKIIRCIQKLFVSCMFINTPHMGYKLKPNDLYLA